MGLLDAISKWAHPYSDEDEDYGEDYLPEQRSSSSGSRRSSYSAEDSGNQVIRQLNTTAHLHVVLLKPERFEDATEAADHLKSNRTVVLNLESTKPEVARRVIDFLAGVAYARDGRIKKIAASTFIITPFNVDLLGDDLIDELESNGISF